MKVNFHQVEVEKVDRSTAKVDVHELLGDFIFNQAEHVDEHDLGIEIYHSEGEMELTEKQCQIVKTAASKMKYVLRAALEKAVSETKEE